MALCVNCGGENAERTGDSNPSMRCPDCGEKWGRILGA
jgi:DNA-directed RNA polymerase subunit RPC12/RpoP